MSQDSHEFESLRRLLALKRHEQPPPGYFEHFSGEVIARIKAGEGAHESAMERLFWDAPWLQRLWAALETKPIMAGAFGAAVCALLVGSVVLSERPETQPLVSGLTATTAIPVQLANNGAGTDQPMTASTFGESVPAADSTAPASAADGIFGLVPRPTATLTTLTLPGSN
ncbi:MAG TPA: hypothetical protein VMU04_24360 [Candidatus Acidoferrum sp.]|nr:hypothetical protein [Candidatus Acidoferrum sp.]